MRLVSKRFKESGCAVKVGSDCREYSYNLLAAINQKLDDEAAGARPPESRGSCSHPASAGCEPNHDCTAPHCAVIRSFNSTDADQCCAACEADVTCGAYTLNHGTGMCWLRTASSPRKAKGRCVSGAVPRAPAPPPAPLPPMPPQPPHIGITFASPDVVAEGSNAQSFYSLPCGTSYCVFGNGGATLWSPSKLWHNASAAAAGFAMPGAQAGTLETIGNLSNSAVDGDAFHGDGQSSLLRFDADGALQVSALESDGEVMTYTGLPCRAYKHRIGSGGTVRMDDGSLLQTVNFKCYNDSQSAVDHPLSVGHSTLGLYQSLDGKHWSYLSTVVSWHQTIGPDGRPEDEGPNENDFVRLPDGSLLVVVRADSGDGVPRRLLRPYFAVTSLDGKAWGEPKTMAATDGSAMGSARPRLLLLGKVKDGRRQGPLVLTGGRPGLYIWVNAAADGKAWEKMCVQRALFPASCKTLKEAACSCSNLAAAHNTAALAPGGPSQRFCSPFVNASLATSDRREGICQLSMSYNSLVRMGDCEAMVLYAMAARSFPGALAACSSDRATVFALRFTASIGAGCSGV